MGREAAAEALIDRELRDIMPRLEFVAPYQFLHRRLVFVGDPFHAQGFLDIAEDLGCVGIRVERPDEIAPALREASAADRPAVVDVVTDANCPAPEPWTP